MSNSTSVDLVNHFSNCLEKWKLEILKNHNRITGINYGVFQKFKPKKKELSLREFIRNDFKNCLTRPHGKRAKRPQFYYINKKCNAAWQAN